MTQEHNSEYLGVKGVCELFGMSPNALYTARHRGEGIGPLAVRIGKRLVWRRSDIEEWFDAQRQGAG